MIVICPNCCGQKTVQRPPWIAGDQPEWTSTGAFEYYPCPTCDAKGWLDTERASDSPEKP